MSEFVCVRRNRERVLKQRNAIAPIARLCVSGGSQRQQSRDCERDDSVFCLRFYLHDPRGSPNDSDEQSDVRDIYKAIGHRLLTGLKKTDHWHECADEPATTAAEPRQCSLQTT